MSVFSVEAPNNQNPAIEPTIEPNRIGPQGVRALMDIAIQDLSITNNNLGPEEARSIAEALKEQRPQRCITHLKLKNNRLGDEGARLIVEAVAQCKFPMYLDLRNNGITQQGALSIVQSLKEKKKFIRLKI